MRNRLKENLSSLASVCLLAKCVAAAVLVGVCAARADQAFTLTYDGLGVANNAAIPEPYPGITAATVTHLGRDQAGAAFEDTFFWGGISPANGYGDLVNVAKGPLGTPGAAPAWGVISITPNYPSNFVRIISMDIASFDDNNVDEPNVFVVVKNAAGNFIPYVSNYSTIVGDANNTAHTHVVFTNNNLPGGGMPIDGPLDTTMQIWWPARNGRVAVDNVQFAIVGPPPSCTKMLVTLPGQTFTSGSGHSGTPNAQMAGVAFNLILTAVDDSLVSDTNYHGARVISYSGPAGSPTYTTAVLFTNGQATGVSTTLKKAETITITTTGGGLTGVASSNLMVNSGPVARLQILLPGETAAPGTATGKSDSPTAQSAGAAINVGIRVNAVDGNWNVVGSAAPNVIITSSDVNATAVDDNGGAAGQLTLGSGTATPSSFTFKTAGARTITATDAAATLAAATSSSVTVNAGAFARLQVLSPGETATPGADPGKTGTPDDQKIGNAFNVTVNAVDSFFNLVTTAFGDTIDVTTSDPFDAEPADNTLAGGTRTFSITPATNGTLTVTTTDLSNGSITPGTSSNITVIVASRLVVTLPGQSFNSIAGHSGTPDAQIAGAAFNLTLTAVNDSLIIDTNYNGARTISYSGPAGSPTYTTSVLFSNGQATNVSTTLKKAETTTITAAASPLTAVPSSNLTVNAGDFAKLQVLAPGETAAPGTGTGTGKTGMPATQRVDAAFNVTVNAVDNFFNLVTTASGDVISVTTSDPADTEPPDNTLAGGTRTFSITPATNGTLTVTATDPSNGGITPGTSSNITVIEGETFTLTYDGLGVANNAAIPEPYPGIVAATVSHFGRDSSTSPGVNFEDVFFFEGVTAGNRYGDLVNVANGPSGTPGNAPAWGVISITPNYPSNFVRIISMDIASFDDNNLDETSVFVVVRNAAGNFTPYVSNYSTIVGDANNTTHTQVVFTNNNLPGGGMPIDGPLDTTMQIWWSARNGRIAVDNVQFATVGPVSPVVARTDFYTVAQGGVLTVPAAGVLENDSIFAGTGPLTAALVQGTSLGTLNFSSSGGFAYTSTSSGGMDGFIYLANDGPEVSSPTAALISVLPPGAIFYDDFARPDNLNLLAPWQVGRSNGVALGAWRVTNGMVLATSAPSAVGYAYVSNNWTDYSVEARASIPTNAYGWTVSGRLNPVNGKQYGVFLLPYGTPVSGKPYTWVLRLVKFIGWDAWSGVPLAGQPDVNVGGPDTNLHALRMTLQGKRVLVHWDGVKKMDIMDNNFEGPPYSSGGFAVGLYTSATNNYVLNIEEVIVRQVPIATNLAVQTAAGISPNLVLQGSIGEGTKTFAIASGPTQGSLSGLNATSGQVTYTPAANYYGQDAFTFTVFDGSLYATGLVSIVVIADLPRLVDIYEAPKGTLNLEWQVYQGRTYRFELATNLVSAVWMTLGATQTAASATLTITNSMDAHRHKFYRALDVAP